jgi:hypothetical protein
MFSIHAAIKSAALLNFECIEATVYCSSGVGHHVLLSCLPFMDTRGAPLGCILELVLASKRSESTPFAPRISASVDARRRAHNYRTGLALHAEHAQHATHAASSRQPEEDDVFAQLLASI